MALKYKATDGPLAGFTVAKLDIDRFIQFKSDEFKKYVSYDFGAKDPDPGSGVVDFDKIDCSGDVRTILMYISHGAFNDLPDGSAMQNHYFEIKGFKHGDYTAYLNNAQLSDGLLRVAIHRPGGRGGDKTGHIWLLINGHSDESYGGHGPGERPWNHQWFLDHVDDIYVLGPIGPWTE